jgi:putative acyl-CoA dehydrogenase
LELGALANKNTPELDTRIDTGGASISSLPSVLSRVDESPIETPHSSPEGSGEGAHAARGRRPMHTEVRPQHGCPITMTFAATPCLKLQETAAQMARRRSSRVYDPRNIPAERSRASPRYGDDRAG